MSDLTMLVNAKIKQAIQLVMAGYHLLLLHWVDDDRNCSCWKGRDCPNKGKHPIPELAPNGLKNATSDIDKIQNGIRCYPNANIAIHAGLGGIFALDFDNPLIFEAIAREHPDVYDTIINITGGGGYHLIYSDKILKEAGLKLRPGIRCFKQWQDTDIRAEGSYILVPPSRNSKGSYRAFNPMKSLENFKPLNPPEWIIEALRSNGLLTEVNKIEKTTGTASVERADYPEEQIIDHFLKLYIEQAKASGRNEACYLLAAQLRDNRIAQSTAIRVCQDFARVVTGLKEEPFTEAEAESTCKSIYASPAREPTVFYSEERKARQAKLAKLW